MSGASILACTPMCDWRREKNNDITVRTYKCEFCSKRCQDLERMERHLREEHPNKDQKEAGFKILTRDQVSIMGVTFSSR